MSYCYLAGDDVVCLPPKMADGRILTDYRSASLVNMSLQTKVGPKNQYSYRQYLMKNGNMVEAEQRNRFENRITVLQKNAKKPKSVPEQFLTVCQGNKCDIHEINAGGLGVGRMPTENWTPLTQFNQ